MGNDFSQAIHNHVSNLNLNKKEEDKFLDFWRCICICHDAI